MKFFGQTNTSTPNQNGYTTVPVSGFIVEDIDSTKLDPFGTSYMVTIDGKIDLQALINEVKVIDQLGQTTVLYIESVDILPDPMELGKCYVSSKPGFQNTIYLSLAYANYKIQYKLGIVSSVLTVENMNAIMPIGKFVLSMFPNEQSKYLKLCNGQTLNIVDYPETAQLIQQTPGLSSILNLTSTTFNMPNLQNVYPLLINEVSGINSIIPGSTESRTSIPKAGFKAPHTHNFTGSNSENGKRNDSAGVTGPRPNQGSTTRTTTTATPSLNFDQFQSVDDSKFKVTETFGGGPYAPMYTFMVVR